MKKPITRWYEKDEYLKAFMSLLQDLPLEKQCEIALDIIIQASKYIERDYSKIIEEIAHYNPKNYKRWYDRNPNVHLAIESFRDLTIEQREEVIKEFVEIVLSSNNIKFEGLYDE